jgi:hypothetical protein
MLVTGVEVLLIVREVTLSVIVIFVPPTNPLILGVGAAPLLINDVPPAVETLVTTPVTAIVTLFVVPVNVILVPAIKLLIVGVGAEPD